MNFSKKHERIFVDRVLFHKAGEIHNCFISSIFFFLELRNTFLFLSCLLAVGLSGRCNFRLEWGGCRDLETLKFC